MKASRPSFPTQKFVELTMMGDRARHPGGSDPSNYFAPARKRPHHDGTMGRRLREMSANGRHASGLAACLVMITVVSAAAAEHPGMAIYRQHCARCHGEGGRGTADYPEPLIGGMSIGQLAASIEKTMPEDDPAAVTGMAARQVADYIHTAFYSSLAQDRHRPARRELARLTVREFRETLADLIGSFRGRGPEDTNSHGLRGEYFRSRDFNRQHLVCEQVDPEIRFDFGIEGPDPERFSPHRFAIRWTGSIIAPETGHYEFILRSEHAVKLSVNSAWYEPPLIDRLVQSGDEKEHRAGLTLLGGRAYPIRLEFSKATQGVDSQQHEHSTLATVELLWKPPHGVEETVPERCLIPVEYPETFVLTTPLPPDDHSLGYDRGTIISPEWFAATTAAAIETADYCLDRAEHLARVKRDAADRGVKLEAFAAAFAARAFRRPLDADLEATFVRAPFSTAPDLDSGLKRSMLLVLSAPRFLYRESDVEQGGSPNAFNLAARISSGLWDSIPDQPLWEAAGRDHLRTPEQIRNHAERMLADRRTRAKIHDFLFGWLRIDQGPELVKDESLYPTFSPALAAAMRTSLSLLLDEIVWSDGSDFRRLFTHDEVFVNSTLAPLFGLSLPADSRFRSVRLDAGQRAGLLTHPYTLSMLAYADATSPIHRGVFLARSVLGNVLKPPQEAISPLAADLHPELTTRERIDLQTSPAACQTCHSLINPLGFALEDFDAVGRYRRTESIGDHERAIDATGGYHPRTGEPLHFRGGRELGTSVAVSRDAAEAFVQNLFHAVVKQPIRAWGPDTLDHLVDRFIAAEYSIRRLLVEILLVAASPAADA